MVLGSSWIRQEIMIIIFLLLNMRPSWAFWYAFWYEKHGLLDHSTPIVYVTVILLWFHITYDCFSLNMIILNPYCTRTFFCSHIYCTFMWPCIVTNFFFNKPNRHTNFPNLFCQETLHVSGSFSAQHQEFSTVHSAVVYIMQVWWHIPMPNVQWKTPDDGQRNMQSFLTKQIWEISASVGSIKK